MKLNGFKLFIENNSQEEKNFYDCIIDQLLSSSIFIDYFYRTFSGYYFDKARNEKDIPSIVKSFIKESNSDRLVGMFSSGRYSYKHYFIDIFSYINKKETIEAIRQIDYIFNTNLQLCIKNKILTDDQKVCMLLMIQSIIESFSNKYNLPITQITSILKTLPQFNDLITALQSEILIDQIIYRIKECDKKLHNIFGQENIIYNYLYRCIESDNEIDWRPKETTPEDYYAL